jgi:hypothetical protein
MHLPLLNIPLVIKILFLVMMMNLSLVNFTKNPNAIIKGLMKQVRVRDGLLEQQEELVVVERKSNEELKKLLALEKGKVDKLDQEHAQSKETTSNLEVSIGALRYQYDVLQKIHQDLKVQFDTLWSSTSKTSSDPEAPKASTSRCCERCYNIDRNTLCDQGQPPKVEQVLVESCDKAIGKENYHLKNEVKRLDIGIRYPGYRGPPVTAQNSGYDRFPLEVNSWGTIHPIPGNGSTTPD